MALTRTTYQKEEISIDMPCSDTFHTVLAALKGIGKVQSAQEKFGRIVGSVGSGTWNMNKADLTIQVHPSGENGSKVVITATAQEGLISQNTAAKAITRLLDAL